MKKTTLVSLLLLTIFSLSFLSFKKEEADLKTEFSSYFLKSVSGLILTYDSLYKPLYFSDLKDIDLARKLFFQVRYAYKKNEVFIEYFAPSTAAMLNMPLIPDVDEYDPNQFTQEPEGLQKIEEILFENDTFVDFDLLKQELKRTRGAILRAQQVAQTLEPQEYQLFEASKLELIRIWTINLTGIDVAYTKNAIRESKYALHTLHDLLSLLENKKNKKQIVREIKQTKELTLAAENYLMQHTDFDSFDRLTFVKKFINPIYSNFTNIELGMSFEKNPIATAINEQAYGIFQKNAWNISYFTSEKRNTSNDKIVALGKMLFYDPILSGNNQRACASCHRSEYGFAEPIATSLMFGQEGVVARNAPTLLNVAFQKAFFLDASTTYLEDQVVVVNQNVNEMHGNFAQLANKLNGSIAYQQLFKNAFEGTADTAISKYGIVKAIASFERSLISMNSKFDKYMRNESVSFSSSEKNGFNLFMGKAQCGTCHFAPFFNGTVPPNFDKSEWEIIGVPENANNKKLDADLGRFEVAKMEIHQYAFKTTTVRNVEYTAPYMHNGVYKDLNQVLDFYNNGGGIGHGYEVPNQTLPADSLNLSSSEMNDIIAFMNSLSDTVGLTQKPNQLPLVLINGIELKRKIGGEY